MKKFVLIIILISALLFYFSCNKSSNPVNNNTNQTSAAAYYPGNEGSNFDYSIQVDSLGQNTQGERKVAFTGTTAIENTTYFIQSNSNILPASTTNTNTYFRRTDGGVFFFIDTTGLYRFIPASLAGSLTIEADKELGVLTSNLNVNNSWKAYKLNVKFGSLFNISVIDLTAYYQGTEDLTLNIQSGQVNESAEKINYVFTLSIPDTTDFTKLNTSTFESTAWFVKDLGLVKCQGNLTVVNAISGYGIDFDDTIKTIVQNLKSYTLK